MSLRFRWSALRESFAYTPKTLGLAWRSAPRMTMLLMGLTLAAALFPLGIAYAGKAIIDAVVAKDSDLALLKVLIELGLVAGQGAVIRTLGLTQRLLGQRLSVDINVMILAKAQTLELRHFEDADFYDQLTRARREASSRPVSVVIDTFQLLQNTLTLAGYIAVLMTFNGWIVVGLFLAALPATLAEMYFSNAAFQLRNRRSPDARRLNYVEHVLANDAHAKEVMIFKIGGYLLQRYRDLGEKLFREDQTLAVKRGTVAYFLSLTGTFAFYGCYIAMVIAAATGKLTLGNLTLFVMALHQGQAAFQAILDAIGGMYESNLYMSNLFSYMDIPVNEGALPARKQAPLVTNEEGIRFEHVSFKYPGQEDWVLNDIDLFIPRGHSLALVGHNGAGKTSLIKLLTRLYSPTQGRILLDGRDLADWDEEALRKRFGVVFQDFNRYHFTFDENVGFGSIDHMGEDERIERAIDLGGAREVLNSLAEGRQTPLGKWFHAGRELSGGQWQKVALARAFMREEADILILDEPTAALDAEAEHAVFERFRLLTKNRTAILISHRFPTVRMADLIVVIEAGRIQEQGTHAELLAKHGRYAQLFELQARGYT